jgi:hypothetical protein
MNAMDATDAIDAIDSDEINYVFDDFHRHSP